MKSFITPIRTIAAALIFALAVLGTLFVLEAGPLAGTTERAYAWSCSMNASAEQTPAGSTVTISWSGASDVSYVTIDQFPGETFEREGSIEVAPAEKTTYTAYTHIEDSADTMQCSVTVSITPQDTEEEPDEDSSCDTAVLSVDGTAFTWEGCPYMERYEATFCDGSTTGMVEGTWEEEKVSIDLGKQIEHVKACGDGCHREASQVCSVPEVPVAPSCPFAASANTTVVDFSGTRLFSNSSEAAAKSDSYSVSLPAGTYKIQTASWDGYPERVNATQPNEQWYLSLSNNSTEVVRSTETTDVPDLLVEALVTEKTDNNLVIPQAIDALTVVHSAYFDDSSYNSVYPICAALTKETSTNPKTPSCKLSATPQTIKPGGSTKLSWDGMMLVDGTIDHNVGTTTAKGSKNVKPGNTTTYTGTFTTTEGTEVQCRATVSVSTGGGSCLNCGDDDDDDDDDTPKGDDDDDDKDDDKDEPEIVLAKTITHTGSFITLDQVPYTGFEAGPIVTMFFWITILALSLVIAYVVNRMQPLARVQHAFNKLGTQYQTSRALSTETHEEALATVHAASAPVATAPVTLRTQVPGVASDDGAGMIEEVAHRDNILLSPEATRLIMQAIAASGENSEGFLSKLFSKVTTSFPREDGWILLSNDRAQSLLDNTSVQNTPVPDEPTPTPNRDATRPISTTHEARPHRVAPQPVTMAEHETIAPVPQKDTRTVDASNPTKPREVGKLDSIVPLFLELLVSGEQKKTFELLRRLSSQGESPEMFISSVVRKLDDIYKNRLEGNHNPDKELSTKTMKWNNNDFEVVLGTLVECIDYSYSSNRIGTKIALAKIFEHFNTQKG